MKKIIIEFDRETFNIFSQIAAGALFHASNQSVSELKSTIAKLRDSLEKEIEIYVIREGKQK